jgi:hypothetical protein
MPHVVLFPECRREIDHGVDGEMALTPANPRGRVVRAHNDREPQRDAVNDSFERLAAADIEDRKGSPEFSRLHSRIDSSRHATRNCNSQSNSAGQENYEIYAVQNAAGSRATCLMRSRRHV